ncbi:hypothetical protein D3H65_13585 [Paraflavitalea soli]|uniref:Uncharacterized protein n=1 Tax=Paraflavitalea soli TaxID=2315862 RepID=A0A3B7MNQ2_9BACT|nr:hypothetical protein [Paraflavitalea soli]AXY74953.1 hypothetical protein D3H65_13585 [Paraflavitalea soli]
MTFKHQYKVLIVMMLLLAHACIANAQDEEKKNTGESLGKQYRDNRVPGLKYAPEQPKAQKRATIAEQQENHSESSGMQLKKGTIKGMRFAPGAGSARSSSAARSLARTQPASGTLPSDQKAVNLPPAPVKIAPVPTQDGGTVPKEVKQAPAGTAPAPVPAGTPATEKKKQALRKNLN